MWLIHLLLCSFSSSSLIWFDFWFSWNVNIEKLEYPLIAPSINNNKIQYYCCRLLNSYCSTRKFITGNYHAILLECDHFALFKFSESIQRNCVHVCVWAFCDVLEINIIQSYAYLLLYERVKLISILQSLKPLWIELFWWFDDDDDGVLRFEWKTKSRWGKILTNISYKRAQRETEEARARNDKKNW